jgi:hypothetical protein
VSYIENNKRNLIMYLGLGLSLVGIALYDPFGILFTGMGMVVIVTGLCCMFVGYLHSNEGERINKAVDRFKKK